MYVRNGWAVGLLMVLAGVGWLGVPHGDSDGDLNTSMDALVFSGLLEERLVNPLLPRGRGHKTGEVACVLLYALFA